MRRSPVETALLPLHLINAVGRDAAEDFVAKNVGEIERLLGAPLPHDDPSRALQSLLEAVKGLRFRKVCSPDADGSICVYCYKELSAKEFAKHPILAAMRGTVVKWYSNGESRTLAFPFAKFFNYREAEFASRVPQRFIATLKLDGTLVIAWRGDDGQIHYNTRQLLENYEVTPGKMGFYTKRVDHIANPYIIAFIYAVKRMGLEHDLENLVREGTTAMFELVCRVPASRASSTYIFSEITPYDESWRPFALATRDLSTFEITYVESTNFPKPLRFQASFNELLHTVSQWRDQEGVVVYEPGATYFGFDWWSYMLKLKSLAYLLLSEAVAPSGEIRWRGVARLVLSGLGDDVKALLGSNKEVAEFVDELESRLQRAVQALEQCLNEFREALSSQSFRNRAMKSCRAATLLELLELAASQGTDKALRIHLLHALPRKKEKILSQVTRLARYIEKAYTCIKKK